MYEITATCWPRLPGKFLEQVAQQSYYATRIFRGRLLAKRCVISVSKTLDDDKGLSG